MEVRGEVEVGCLGLLGSYGIYKGLWYLEKGIGVFIIVGLKKDMVFVF